MISNKTARNNIFKKYLSKKAVQDGIVSGIVEICIKKILRVNEPLECSYISNIIFVKNTSQELSQQIFFQRTHIINIARQKLLEEFGLNSPIKDIKTV